MNIFNTIVMVIVKKLTSRGVDPIDMAMFRSLLNATLSFPIIYKHKKHPINDIGGTGLKFTLLCRCITGTICFYMLILESSWLPIFIAQTFNNTTPFFTALFGFYILGEKMSKLMMLCMIGCFFGVAILNEN